MVWSIHTAQAALENVDMMAIPYKVHRHILSLSGLFLKHKTKNNGQNAIKKKVQSNSTENSM